MSNDLRKGTPNLENVFDVCSVISELTELHSIEAMSFDTKSAFRNNTPDLITAQNILVANNSTFTLVKEEAAENKNMFAPSFETRTAKAKAGFKSNMNVVHKTIATPKGHVRGYETDGSGVIKVNFKANRFHTLSPTGS